MHFYLWYSSTITIMEKLTHNSFCNLLTLSEIWSIIIKKNYKLSKMLRKDNIDITTAELTKFPYYILFGIRRKKMQLH